MMPADYSDWGVFARHPKSVNRTAGLAVAAWTGLDDLRLLCFVFVVLF